ncbi:methionyl-tRNA formyltransferase [Candidatus Uhrbacteria bacterium]|nr:methionyl-tRNA formyltransferase [Candidatus Uhrbacteria bacterium]
MAITCILLATPEFAIPTAQALLQSPAVTLIGVLTRPDEPVGRKQVRTPPPMAVWATEHQLSLRQPQAKGELAAVMRELQPDVAVVVAYGKLIPPDALAVPRFGYVNVHPSLLPKYRGPSPMHAAIANGDTETGISIMCLDAEMDHGPILAQQVVPLTDTMTRLQLERLLATCGAELLLRTLPAYVNGQCTPMSQDDARATYCKLLTRADGQLDWRVPATSIERKVRAYEGWPGTWCLAPNGKRLKILRLRMGTATREAPGTLVMDDASIAVAAGDGRSLWLDLVQPEGGVVMEGVAFARGLHRTDVLRLM